MHLSSSSRSASFNELSDQDYISLLKVRILKSNLLGGDGLSDLKVIEQVVSPNEEKEAEAKTPDVCLQLGTDVSCSVCYETIPGDSRCRNACLRNQCLQDEMCQRCNEMYWKEWINSNRLAILPPSCITCKQVLDYDIWRWNLNSFGAEELVSRYISNQDAAFTIRCPSCDEDSCLLFKGCHEKLIEDEYGDEGDDDLEWEDEDVEGDDCVDSDNSKLEAEEAEQDDGDSRSTLEGKVDDHQVSSTNTDEHKPMDLFQALGLSREKLVILKQLLQEYLTYQEISPSPLLKFLILELGVEEVRCLVMARRVRGFGKRTRASEFTVAHTNLLSYIPIPERRAAIQWEWLRRTTEARPYTKCCLIPVCMACRYEDHHDGQTCAEAQQRVSHDDDDNLIGTTFKCPNCFILLQHAGGCSSIRCLVCRHEFDVDSDYEEDDEDDD